MTYEQDQYVEGYAKQMAWLEGKTAVEADAALSNRLATLEPTPYNRGGTQATAEYLAKLSEP